MNYAQTIALRYRIEGRLGVGGMSTVYLAFDERLERNVAIKLLAEHLADDATFVARRPEVLYYLGRAHYASASYGKAVDALERSGASE